MGVVLVFRHYHRAARKPLRLSGLAEGLYQPFPGTFLESSPVGVADDGNVVLQGRLRHAFDDACRYAVLHLHFRQFLKVSSRIGRSPDVLRLVHFDRPHAGHGVGVCPVIHSFCHFSFSLFAKSKNPQNPTPGTCAQVVQCLGRRVHAVVVGSVGE